MDRTTNPLVALARLTVTDPQAAARQLRGVYVPRPVLWQGFALVVITSVLLTELAVLAVAGGAAIDDLIALGPWGAAGLQALFLVVMVHAIHRIGGAFGGTGSFDDSLKLMVWLQALLVVFQVVQVMAMLLLPGLSNILGLIATGWFFWVLTTFIMVLHGFQSRGKVFLGVMATFIAFVVAMSIILPALGIIEFAPGGVQ